MRPTPGHPILSAVEPKIDAMELGERELATKRFKAE